MKSLSPKNLWILPSALLIVLFGTITFPNTVHAQETEVVKDGKESYIIHTVEAKQTLYAIAKMYSVSVEDIQKANPELNSFGIRIGQTLRIPVAKVDKKEQKKSEIEIKGDTIYHEVVKKETIYALTKKYDISEEELYKFNPALKDGLKIGMIVKVPTIPEQDEKQKVEFEKPVRDSLVLHQVQPKETLYSLSKKYGVTPDSIQMVNDGLPLGLQMGSTIRIPIPISSVDTIQWDTLAVDTNQIIRMQADTLNVAVFLPFCTSKLEPYLEGDHKEPYFLSKISLDFYRGFNIAMDSLSKLGHTVNVRYFDTENDTVMCKKLVADSLNDSYNLFVGPLFQKNFKYIAAKAKEKQIPIISPVKVSSRLLLDNKYVTKSHASSPSQVIYMAQYMAKNLVDSNVVLISSGDKKDKRYADIFQKYYYAESGDSLTINRLWQPNRDNVKQYVKSNDTTHIMLVSSNEAFVSGFLTSLYRMRTEGTKVRVYGIDSWSKFNSIDLSYLLEMKVTYPAQQKYVYGNDSTDNFAMKFRERYYTDPMGMAFSGMDIGFYFGKCILMSNGDWEQYLLNHQESGLSLRFDFVKISDESGFENRGGYILQYDNFELKVVY